MRKPTPDRSTGVHTVQELQHKHRGLDRRTRAAESVVAAMRAGASLHPHYQKGRAIWSLFSRSFVSADVAAVVVTKIYIVTVGDALFHGLPGQTWRYTEACERLEGSYA
jgi:hypothetical protein